MSTELDTVIEDSISDAELAPEPVEAQVEPEQALEATPEAPQSTQPEAKVEDVKDTDAKPVDEFDKKFGLTPNSATGRENRIPYSRVKKITEKAVKDARLDWDKEHTPKFTEVETRVKDYETKVKDYEERFKGVAQFETFMMNDKPGFLQRLASIPGYDRLLAPIFNQGQAALAETTDPRVQTQSPSGMPQPDQRLSDGSSAYSMKGLEALNAWNRAQAKAEALEEMKKTYGPMYEEYSAQQRLQTVIPQVQKQIDEARKWPQFNENEEDIVKALSADSKLSLEGAYQKVVFPRLVSDRNKVREELLAEIKRAPVATSAPARSSRPNPVSSGGPRDLTDIINEALKTVQR